MSKLYDLARVTVTSAPGVGHLPLGPAIFGFLTFPLAGVQNGDVVTYAISDSQQSEIGHGTYTTLTNILTRDTVLSSTNGGLGGSPINASSSCQVFITIAAEDISQVSTITIGTTAVAGGSSNGLLYNNAGALGNLATGNNGVLVTSGAGVPSISSTLPTSLIIPNATSISTAALSSTGTLTVGAPTGGALSTGTVNVSGGYYVNNVSVSSIFTSTTAGLVPASGGGTLNFLRADGTFAVPPVTVPAYAMLNALDFSVTGNGTTDDSSAINTFLTTCLTAGAIAYFPTGLTYNCGSSQITVPNGLSVIAGGTATFVRSADVGVNGASWPAFYQTGQYGSLILLGSNCDWTGGILNNTAILATSVTSITPGTGTKTWTIGAGANIAVGNFIRIQSNGVGSIHMEGTVTSYSGTTLAVNVVFANGTVRTDWSIYSTGVWQAAIALNNASNSTLNQVTVQGNWYVGVILSAWNVAVGSGLTTQNCSVAECSSIGVFNRGFYQYGNCTHNVFDNCFVNGNSGKTDYGFNNDPANPSSGGFNTITYASFVSCQTVNTLAQGIGVGDLCLYFTITNFIVNATVQSAGVGILIEAANGSPQGSNEPQFMNISNCIAKNCPTAGFSLVGTAWTNLTGCTAVANGIGFEVLGNGVVNCAEVSLQNIVATGNNIGVFVGASQANTLITGRSTSNTSTPLSDAGSGTVSTGLITT